MNYYNDSDPFVADWLRELIRDRLIPEGVVDDRSIVEVESSDVREFKQCHFFAGIGGWSRAFDLAGWGNSRPVWSGSPPCQPFSTAGNQLAQGDERHLWPEFFRLIRECKPRVLFGEQVAAAVGFSWLDVVLDQLAAEGYAAGSVVLPACGVGAFHKRDRIFYFAERMESRAEISANALGFERVRFTVECDPDGEGWCRIRDIDPAECDCIGPTQDGVEYREIDGELFGRLLADGNGARLPASSRGGEGGESSQEGNESRGSGESSPRGLADTLGAGSQGRIFGRADSQREVFDGRSRRSGRVDNSGFWGEFEFVRCKDFKLRPIPAIEPGVRPLVDGISAGLAQSGGENLNAIARAALGFPLIPAGLPNRNSLIRGAGNAIVPQVAEQIIRSYMEIVEDRIAHEKQ